MNILRYIFILVASTMLLCCSESGYYNNSEEQEFAANISIEQLIDGFYGGAAVEISQDLIISGIVSTSDSSSNFYNTFIIDDGTAAIEILCGFYDVYTLYKVGRRVYIELSGLTLGEGSTGGYALGMASSSIRDVEYFESPALAKKYITAVDEYSTPYTFERTISTLSADDALRRVLIRDLTFAPDDQYTWAPESSGDTKYEGTIYFCDENADSVKVTTSGYALFAAELVPTEMVDITGILLWSSDTACYLKLNDESDAQLCQ